MTDNSQDNKRIAKNTLFMGIRMIIVLGITFYSSRVILDALGVTDYGVYNAVASFVAMFLFLKTSLANGIQRFFNFELGKNGTSGSNKVYNTALIIQILLALIIVIPAEIFGTWYLNTKMVIPADRLFAANWVFQSSLFTLVLHILQVPYSAAIAAHERFGFYALMSVLNAVLTLAAAFLIPYLGGDKLIIYGFLIAAIAAIDILVYIIYAKKNFEEIKIKRTFEKELFKGMLSFSGWNIFGTFGHMLKYQGTSLVLNLFFGPLINAAYGIANQVNSGLQGFVNNITTPVRPQVMKSYAQGRIDRTLNLTYTISKATCLFLLLMSLPVMLEIDFILDIWLGNNIPPHTATIIILIIIDSYLNNLNSCTSGVVHASGIMKAYQLSGGLISLSTIIFIYLGLYLFKIPEIAFVIIIILDCIRQLVAIVILKKIVPEFSYKAYTEKVLYPFIKVAAIGIIIPLLVQGYMHPGLIRFITVSIISLLSVGICIYFFGINKAEKHIIANMAKPIFNKLFRNA